MVNRIAVGPKLGGLMALGALALSLFVAPAARAQDGPTLKVGSAAPGLDVKAWVKGEETTINSDRVYLIEFWATWCGPCKKAMPHLTELQRKYGEDQLCIIGVSTESLDTVKSFVMQQGPTMGYTVVVDKDNSTSRMWMEAAGKNAIPCSFIVDRAGKIQFIGNPHDSNFDSTLDKIIDGRYDAKLQRRVEPTLNAADNARKVHNWRMAEQLYREVIGADAHEFALVNLEIFEMKLLDMDQADAAYAMAMQLIADSPEDTLLMSRLVSKITRDPQIPDDKRRLDVAWSAATAATQNLDPSNPERFALSAMVKAKQGLWDEAIDLQRQAWRAARPGRKDHYKRDLDEYQKARKRETMQQGK